MNPSKIYSVNNSECVARTIRALKRKIHNKKVANGKFFFLQGKSRIEFTLEIVQKGFKKKRDCYRVKM